MSTQHDSKLFEKGECMKSLVVFGQSPHFLLNLITLAFQTTQASNIHVHVLVLLNRTPSKGS